VRAPRPQARASGSPEDARAPRERLLATLGEQAARHGYEQLTASQLIAAAGVSRATFYSYFADKEACLLAALEALAPQLLAEVDRAVACARPEHAARAAVRALVSFAASRPLDAHLLMAAPLAGAERLRDARDRLLDDAARVIDDAHWRLSPGAPVPALPARLICAVTCRMLASRLRRGERELAGLARELTAWLEAYELPSERRCWRLLEALPRSARSPYLPPDALRAPPAPAPRGARPRPDAQAEEHWLRIVVATVEVIARDGYAGASVASILAAAALDSRSFYRLFDGKAQALAAADELLFRRALACAAGAFAAGETWPERVFEAARALVGFAEQNRSFTRVALLESHAGALAERVCDLARAFTIFLQEGDRHRERTTARTSEPQLEAIATAVYELGYRHLRERPDRPLTDLLAPILFVSLAPFLGAGEAGEFVCLRLRRAREPTGLVASAA
jgi:AcrR family transcriptional regulator